MSIVDQIIEAWHKLPVSLTSAIASVATFTAGSAFRYLTETNPHILTWGGLGAATIAGLANWADSKVRLHQNPPEAE